MIFFLISFCLLKENIVKNKITVHRNHAVMGPNAIRLVNRTNVYVHLALQELHARTTRTSANINHASMENATTPTEVTRKYY